MVFKSWFDQGLVLQTLLLHRSCHVLLTFNFVV